MRIFDRYRRWAPSLGLRPVVGGVTAVLSLLAVTTCLALIFLTTTLRRETELSSSAARSVRLVETVRVRLLGFGRASDLALLYRDRPHELARQQAESDLLQAVAAVRTQEIASRHGALLDHTEQRIREYLAARHGAEVGARSLRDVMGRASGPLEAALEATGRLVDGELAYAALAERRASTWGRIAVVIGIALSGVFITGFVGVLGGLRALLYRPIVALHGSIAAFAAGDKRSRATEAGVSELRGVAHVFNEMADRLAREEENRLTFLAGVAHDLRNPLGALGVAAQVLDPERPLPDEERVRKTIALFARQVTRLDRMVGDLLDAARIEAGRLELCEETCDLRGIVEQVARLYETASAEHPICLSVPAGPVAVRCDPVRIEQVLNNLLSNAIKYAPAGGPVAVELSTGEGEARVSVTDRGIGVAPEDLPHIFEPFRRARSSRETIPGAGLGLSVARKIVESHGGRIEVTSRPGAGSTFVVHLPLSSLTSDDRAARTEPPLEEPPPSIH